MARAQAGPAPTRVVVVDDSPTIRASLVAIFQNASNMQVAGTARNGEDALRIVKRLKPDVITMDIHMPGMGGLEAIRRIMQEVPTPIVVVSSSLLQSETDLAFEAIRAGALNVVLSPGLNDPQAHDRLVETVRLMADVSVVHHWRAKEKEQPSLIVQPEPVLTAIPIVPAPIIPAAKVIGIAASTGGPGILAAILKPLPADFPIPILVVQHIAPGFGAGLAAWLSSILQVQVKLASQGEEIHPGTVFLAPDDHHMKINNFGILRLSDEPPQHGIRPAANYLFHSLAKNYGSAALGIILTGMGEDGVDGLKALRRAGALTIAQDEGSCVVYGMPGEAVKQGAAYRVLDPENIATLLLQVAKNAEENTAKIHVTENLLEGRFL